MRQMTITGFGDAVVEVTEIRERFGYAHGAMCLDELWCVRDLTVFTDPERHSPWTALDWAHCAILNDERITRVVLLSGVGGDVREACEDDIAEYAHMRASFAEHGVGMVDWILFDGESYRSMAFTVDPAAAWGGLAAQGDRPTGTT